VLIGFLILALTIPQHLINQGAGSIVRGWYWNHLLEFDQFGLKTFFFLEPVISRLNSASIFGSGLSIVTSALSIGLVALCTLSGVRFVHERKHEVPDGELLIALLGVTTVIINIVYLSWLSIRFPTIPQPDNPSWTFVWETRYFTQSMMFILLFVFILPFRLRSSSKLVRKASLAFIALAMTFAGSYWLWKHFDIFWRDRWAGTYKAEKSEDVAIANFLRTRFENQPDTTVLGFSTIASAYGPARIASSAGNGAGDNFQVGHDEQLKTTKQRTLILKFRKELTDEERKFLDERRGIKVLELPNADLYQLEILP
jgi:hypothetical protein